MNPKIFRKRIYFSVLVFIIILILFFLKLSSLHFSKKIISFPKKDEFRRGYIRDRQGKPLAISIEVDSLYANPSQVKNISTVTKVLSSILNISSLELKKKLSGDKKFVWIKRKLSKEKTVEIKKFNFAGLNFRKEYKRVYPHDNLASNLIGFVGIDNIGLEGIEYKYDSILSGQESGFRYNDKIVFGSDLFLTIDKFIQTVAEEEIAEAIKNYKAKQGVVVIMEIKTGRILALAKYPNFNLNYYYNYTSFEHKNFSVVNSFEPGSTLKVIALASLLENHSQILEEKFLCQGKVDFGKVTINCSKKHGRLGVLEIIKYSCNAGIIQAIEEIEKQEYYQTLKNFGFGQKLEVGLPGEALGILRPPEAWSWLSKYSLSIGHEISVTSLQLVAAYSAIANQGNYIRPTIIEAIKKYDDTFLYKFSPKKERRVLKEKNAKILLSAIKGVTEPDGTGAKARSKYYQVAGKTGTSRKFKRNKEGGGYSDQVISSFIGIAPFLKPKICVLVIVDDSADKLSGGTVAAPVFAKIIDRVLPQMGVKGDLIKKQSTSLKKR